MGHGRIRPLIDLGETNRSPTTKNLLESYHDAQQALSQALNLFSLATFRSIGAASARTCIGPSAAASRRWRSRSTISRKNWGAWKPCSRTLISAASRCLKACRIASRLS
ncbi:MAG: hypothetical protein ABSF64_21845 [Bryobacteraceae bacterium]